VSEVKWGLRSMRTASIILSGTLLYELVSELIFSRPMENGARSAPYGFACLV
jgi:hypothetical protein